MLTMSKGHVVRRVRVLEQRRGNNQTGFHTICSDLLNYQLKLSCSGGGRRCGVLLHVEGLRLAQCIPQAALDLCPRSELRDQSAWTLARHCERATTTQTRSSSMSTSRVRCNASAWHPRLCGAVRSA